MSDDQAKDTTKSHQFDQRDHLDNSGEPEDDPAALAALEREQANIERLRDRAYDHLNAPDEYDPLAYADNTGEISTDKMVRAEEVQRTQRGAGADPVRRIDEIIERAVLRRTSELPTIKEFREQWKFLSQKQAAKFLRYKSERSIRVLLDKGKLTRLPGGKVSCSDDKWVRMIKAKHPDYRLQ